MLFTLTSVIVTIDILHLLSNFKVSINVISITIGAAGCNYSGCNSQQPVLKVEELKTNLAEDHFRIKNKINIPFTIFSMKVPSVQIIWISRRKWQALNITT